jgi:hypothetical protein
MSMYWHGLIYLLVCQWIFFIISTTFECITIGHFIGLIVNGNKIMTEIKLLKEGRWEVIVNGKEIDILALNFANHYATDAVNSKIHMLFEPWFEIKT